MKKITAIIFGLLFVATFSHAGAIDKNSSWDDILADDSLRVAFPSISVGNGKFVTYNHLFLDRDRLTTGKDWEDAAQVQNRHSADDKDRAPKVIRTITRKTEAPLNYIGRDCTPASIREGHDSDHVEPLVCNPVTGEHPLSVEVQVYKKGGARHAHDTKDGNADQLLFTKTYSVPVLIVN
jgi:hypothetical protein